MTYSYQALSKMHSPMYQLTMSVRTGSAYLRTDKVLLFVWTVGGLIAGGFFAYAAALMYASVCRMRDIRPAAAVFAILIGSLTLMGHLQLPVFERLMELWWSFAWILLLLPPLLAAALAMLRKERA